MRIEHIPTDDDAATIRIVGLSRDLTILHVTDSHMVEGDERDPEAAQHMTRFTELFEARTPGGVPPRQVFARTLAEGREPSLDAAVLTGDIIHFPARAGIDRIREGIASVGVPTLYTLGNHDWSFPHLEWSDETRQAWYPRFHDLTGGDPACQALDVGGVRLIALDNSTYQVSDRQVEFLRHQLAAGVPCLLFVHIPLAIPSLTPAVMETWKAPIMMGAEEGWTDETRQRWRVPGTLDSTRACLELITAGPDNLAGVFCGHVHFAHVDAYREGRCQYVTAPGFGGGSRVIHLEAM